jgi:hypothetical protein
VEDGGWRVMGALHLLQNGSPHAATDGVGTVEHDYFSYSGGSSNAHDIPQRPGRALLLRGARGFWVLSGVFLAKGQVPNERVKASAHVLDVVPGRSVTRGGLRTMRDDGWVQDGVGTGLQQELLQLSSSDTVCTAGKIKQVSSCNASLS